MIYIGGVHMRTYEWNKSWFSFIAIMFMLGGACVASAQTPSREPLEQRIERLKAEEQKKLENESPRDRLIRLRAEEITVQKARKYAEDKVKSLDSPEMKQARKEIENREREQRKAGENLSKTFATLDLHGCDHATVQPSPAIGNSWGLRSSSIYSMVLVTIVNRRSVPVQISSTMHGTLVGNLCAGGRVTIPFASRSTTANYTQVLLTAVGQSAGPTQVESKSINLYGNRDYNSRQVMSELWELLPR